MANNGGNITFGIGFNVNKSGLNDLKKSLQDIQKATTKDLVGNLGSEEAKKALADVKRSASEIEQALKKAYNPTINSVNVAKFNQQLSKTGINLNTVYQNFSKVQGGSSAFRNLTTQLLTTNMQLKQTHSLLDSMGKTMINTVKWGIASSVMNTFTNSVQKAFNYVKVLDSSLTDIRIVTGQSREEMDRFAESANKAAQNLGRQTKDYTNAALSFYQQGLSEDEVAARTETTLKAANITGAGVSDMANQLTAVWNGFQVGIEDTENVVSKLAAVADTSASNMSQLATAMSKAASVANNMGVDVDQLSAQIATIIATTRQAPETVGNALKTIYARINDIKAGSDEAQVSLGNYTGKMARLGIQVLDQQGNLRDTGQVMEEIGNRWETMTREQQIYLAQTMAGQRQMNNLIALFDNWDMYTKELNISLEAQGTLNEKNARYMESLEAHTRQLTAASEGLIQAFVNGDSFKGFIDIGTNILQLLTSMVDSIGGGGTAILGFGSILTRVFSKQISSEISSFVLNLQAIRQNAQSLAAQKDITNLFQGLHLNENLTQQFIDLKAHVLDFGNIVTVEQHNTLNELLKQRNELENQKQAWNDNKKAAEDFYKSQTGEKIGNLNNSDQNFRKVLNNLQNIRKAAHSAAQEMNTFSASILKDGFIKDVDAEMQYYINTLRDLRKSNKLSTESQNILSESLINYQKVLEKVKAQGLSGEKLLNNKQVKQAAAELISNLANVETQIEQGAQRTTNVVKQAANGTAREIKENIEASEDRIKAFIKNIDTKAAVRGFINLASSIGQVSFAISSLMNLSKTLQDDTLTPMEKTSQIITNLSMTLPMFISGVKGALEAIKSLGVAFGVANVEGATLLAGTMKTLAAFAPYAAVIAIVAGSIYALVKAYNKNSDAAKQAQKDAETLKNQYKELKDSYEDLKSSIEDYQESKKALSELEKGTVGWKNKVEELNQEVLGLIKKYPELAKYVSNVNGQLEISQKGIQELTKAQEIAMQASKMASLSADIYANQTKIVADETEAGRRISYYEEDENDAQNPPNLRTVSQKTIDEIVKGINKNGGLLDQSVLDNLGITNQNLRNALLKTDNREQLQTLAARVYDNTEATAILTEQYVHAANEAAGFEAYNESQHQASIDTQVQEQYQRILDSYIEKYADRIGGMWDSEIQQLWVTRNDNITGYKNRLGNKADYYTKTGEVLTLTDADVRRQLAQQDAMAAAQEAIPQYVEAIDFLVDAGNQIHDNFGDVAAAVLQAKDAEDLIDLSQYSKEEIQNLQNSLSSFDDLWRENGFEHADIYATVLENSIRERLSQLSQQVENFKEILPPSDIGGFRSNLEKYQKGTLKNDELEYFEEVLNSLQDAYPNLIDKVQTLRKSWLAGTDEYQAALSAIEDTLSYNMIDASMQASKAAIEAWDRVFHEQEEFIEGSGISVWDENGEPLYKAEVDLQLDDEEVAEFQDQLNAILDAEHSIDIEIHTDAEQAFEGIQSRFDQITKAAQNIGQGFIVAAEDMRELNNVFPGIMQSMQMLENGTYKLNEDVVKNVTNATMAEAAAEAESVRQRLQSQAELLHAKAKSYQTIADAAAKLASSEVSSSQESASLQGKISEQLSNLKQINSGLAATKENADQKAVADSSQANASITASNWANAANSAAQSIYKFAANAAHNMKAVAEGKPDNVIAPEQIASFFGNGQSGVDQQLSAIESAENTINAGDATQQAFADMAAQFQAMADASEQAANDIDGMLATIGGNVNDIVTGIQDVQAGKAYGSTQKGDKSSKKSGGGGGKDKTKSADQIEKKKLKDTQIDKYHQLDRAIKRVEETIKDLNRAEGKTIRNGLSQTIDKQVAALEQEKGLYEQKIQLMQADLQLMQSELSALGVQFDAQGNIINYTALMIEYQTLYNQLLDEAKLLTGESQEAKLKEAESVKLKLDNLKTQMNAYEQLQDKITDAGNAIEDLLDKQEQLRIKQFKIKIDWQLDKAQAERDWNKFRKDVIEKLKDDDYLGQAKIRLQDFFSYYTPDKGGIIQELTDHVNKTRRQAEIIENGGVSSIYGQNQAQALDDLKHYTDQLMKNLQDVQELAKEIQELYLDTIDKAKDAFDEQLDAYEQIDSIIEHDMNLIQMLQPEDNEQQLAHYYQLRAENNNQEIDFYRRQKDMWKDLMDSAQEGSKEWKKFRDNWMESISSLNSAVEAAVENLLDKYKNTIQQIIRSTKDQVLGGDWKRALDEWDRAKWLDDRYLDIETRATGVLDFIDDVNKAIEGAPLKQQQELLKFMNAEVDRLNNMTRLRQIDLDISNKKLEVLQKQMALEDAQESKTRLRLRRDSQGNYTYQYVADEDQINTREQELRDTLEELRQLAKVDVSDTIDAVEDKLTQFFDKAQELSETYYNNEEMLKEKLYELEDEYFGEEGYITLLGVDYNLMQAQLLEATGAQFSELYRQQREELAAFLGLNTDNAEDGSVWGSILTLIGADGGKIPSLLEVFTTEVIPDNFNKISEENQKLLFGSETGLNPSWDTALGNMSYAVGEMALHYGEAGQFIWNITDQVILPAIASMINATAEYARDLQILQQIAGISFADISNGIDYTIGETRTLVQDNGTLISTYLTEIQAIQGVVQQLQSLINGYDAARNAAIAAAAAAHDFWMEALGRTIDGSATSYSPSPAPSGGGSNGGSTGSRSTGGGSTGGSGSGTSVTYSAAIQKPGATSGGNTSATYYGGNNGGSRGYQGHYRRATVMATGGYTGEWVNGDSQGKLAFLHQKELVLNAEDTKNILSAVDLVRSIMRNVAGLNMSMQNGLPSTGRFSSLTNNNNGMSQSVIINADFPAVSDAQEIKQAFNNLINIASQKASGNRRTY